MPTPLPFVWLTPPNLTVDPSFVVQWQASNVGVNSPPTATILTPAEGSQIARDSTMPVQILAEDVDGSISLVEVLSDGTLSTTANPTTFNPATGYWESTLSLGATSALGARTLQARATDNNGAIGLSAIRNYTCVDAGTSTVQSFVDAVNSRRAALAMPAMPVESLRLYQEMWARLGNRDGELSTNRQGALADLFVLRSNFNVGGGDEIVGLKRTILTRRGTTKPTWGTDVMTFGGTDAFLTGASLLTGATQAMIITAARATGANAAQTVAAQYRAGSNGSLAATRRSSSLNAGSQMLNSAGTISSSETGGSTYLGNLVGWMAGFTAGAGEHPRVRAFTPLGSETQFTGQTELGAVSVPGVPFTIGGRFSSDGVTPTTLFVGDIAVAAAINVRHAADAAAIWTILASTVLADVRFG